MESQRDISRISDEFYVGMCDILGTPIQVKIRRDVIDTMEILSYPCGNVRTMASGSYREGFRLKTSDRDLMTWLTTDIVICDLSQIPPYNPSQTLILMECHNTPPGFAKLQLLTPTNNLFTRQSCVSDIDQLYISSSLFREFLCNFAQEYFSFDYTTCHGPCTSGFDGPWEVDMACCFSCQHWPHPAYQWIKRCQRQGWPSSQVLQDIIDDGCHLMAIGSKRSTSPQECETEWRMSFSQAEYKLVYSMNHTQFLCYGVLKIFLKEVLNVGLENPLLCSYFIKTTLFWKVQENTISHWSPKHFIYCVWTCFKYLIRCVYRGEFPNFFIPQNNMFINKIHGAAQKQLFLQLLNLYNMGVSCLLRSPSLYKVLSKAILYPNLQISTDDINVISEFELDAEFITEISNNHTFLVPFPYVMCNADPYKTIPSYSQNHVATEHVIRNAILIYQAFCLDKSRDDNTMHTTDNCRSLDMLISAAECGFISDSLYVAIYLYNKRKYTDALYYIDRTKQKLRQPCVLYSDAGSVNRESYMEAVRGRSMIDKMKTAVSYYIRLDQICCIDEVRLELHVSMQHSITFLCVSPLVMTHMLSFLCHHHLGDRLRSRHSLDDLKALLHNDERQVFTSRLFKDISWQMLGICEQIYGDKESALCSYHQSYLQYPYHKINTASWVRLQNVISK